MARKTNTASREMVMAAAGFRCVVPTCRALNDLDAYPLAGDELVCLCAACQQRYRHQGIPSPEVMAVYQDRIQELSRALERSAIDLLLYLGKLEWLAVSGDKVVEAAALLNAGYLYADYKNAPQYRLRLTHKGRQFMEAWLAGQAGPVAAGPYATGEKH